VSCQNFEQGLFTGYEQMARDEPDAVFHLGDYIYEYEAGRNGKVRTHLGQELATLDDYRTRYAQYRSDPLLHTMHAQCPWWLTWDDHEFDNNCAGEVSEESGIDPVDFLYRRANAYQAYYEMMPLRSRTMPRGSDMRLYRKASYGRLAEFMILDTRQYRSDQPNGDRKSPLNESALDTKQTILGRKQRNWLCNKLILSQAKWNVLAQQVMMGMVDRNGDPSNPGYSMDQWPGYANERARMMEFLRDREIENPVVLTGDIHSNWVNELRVDDRRADDPIIATEFVGTSLSSGGNGPAVPKNLDALMAANPCLRYHNAQRGYVRCDVTWDSWRADYMVTDDVLRPGGTTTVGQSFVIENGQPGVQDA
jgi:alkaline phosphatase D